MSHNARMDIWKRRLEEVERAGRRRELRRVDGAGTVMSTDAGSQIVFCSNDYLGMAAHPEVKSAAAEAMSVHGVGSGASRLVSGNSSLHDAVEQQFANWVGFEDGVLFPSGYQANVGILSALAQKGDVIFSDARCHASIIDGCRLSRARVVVFQHNDVEDLARCLQEEAAGAEVKLVVTEGIFSMDGDMPPLRQICSLARRHGAAVVLDEAHSIGILGPRGSGLAAQRGLSGEVDVLIGTFGKALGVSGAVVACGTEVADLLRSTARSLLYTTAAAPLICAATLKSMEMVSLGGDRRSRLFANVALFRHLSKQKGICLLESETPIQPMMIGDPLVALSVSQQLLDRGFFVQAIRPPTVPDGTSRLRITISSQHTEEQISGLISALWACRPGAA